MMMMIHWERERGYMPRCLKITRNFQMYVCSSQILYVSGKLRDYPSQNLRLCLPFQDSQETTFPAFHGGNPHSTLNLLLSDQSVHRSRSKKALIPSIWIIITSLCLLIMSRANSVIPENLSFVWAETPDNNCDVWFSKHEAEVELSWICTCMWNVSRTTRTWTAEGGWTRGVVFVPRKFFLLL